jgi:hypothetical protein
VDKTPPGKGADEGGMQGLETPMKMVSKSNLHWMEENSFFHHA